MCKGRADPRARTLAGRHGRRARRPAVRGAVARRPAGRPLVGRGTHPGGGGVRLRRAPPPPHPRRRGRPGGHRLVHRAPARRPPRHRLGAGLPPGRQSRDPRGGHARDPPSPRARPRRHARPRDGPRVRPGLARLCARVAGCHLRRLRSLLESRSRRLRRAAAALVAPARLRAAVALERAARRGGALRGARRPPVAARPARDHRSRPPAPRVPAGRLRAGARLGVPARALRGGGVGRSARRRVEHARALHAGARGRRPRGGRDLRPLGGSRPAPAHGRRLGSPPRRGVGRRPGAVRRGRASG